MNGLSEAVPRDQVLMKEIKRADWFLLLLFLFVSLAPWYLLERPALAYPFLIRFPLISKGHPSHPANMTAVDLWVPAFSFKDEFQRFTD